LVDRLSGHVQWVVEKKGMLETEVRVERERKLRRRGGWEELGVELAKARNDREWHEEDSKKQKELKEVAYACLKHSR